MAEDTRGTFWSDVKGNRPFAIDAFDLKSWQGLTAVLQAGRDAGLSPEAYAEFRNLVLEYAQRRGDQAILKKITTLMDSATSAPSPLESPQPREVKQKAKTPRASTEILKAEKQKPSQAPVPKASSVPQPLEPLPPQEDVQTKTSERTSTVKPPLARRKISFLPQNIPPATDTLEEEPVPAPAPAPESEPEPEVQAGTPLSEEETPATEPNPYAFEDTPPMPQPSPKPEPAVEPTVVEAPRSPEVYRARILEIKRTVNATVGNPIALVDAKNQVGRTYMTALLNAMKATGPGSTADSRKAMADLEVSYKAILAYWDERKRVVEEPMSEPALAFKPEPEPEPAPTPAPTPTVTQEQELEAVSASDTYTEGVEQELPARGPQSFTDHIDSVLESARNTAEVAATAGLTHDETHEARIPSLLERLRHNLKQGPIASDNEAYKPPTPPLPETPTGETGEPTSSIATGQETSYAVPTTAPRKRPPIAAPVPARPIANDQIPGAESIKPSSDIALRQSEPVSPEVTNSLNQFAKTSAGEISKRVSSIATEQETSYNAPTAPRKKLPIATPVPARPIANDQIPGAESFKPSSDIALRQSELVSPEVTYSLNQLLHEWKIFTSSGLFGTGPSGQDHPLYQRLAKLSMGEVIAGRWERADQTTLRSIKDYVNAWRHEQGIAYMSTETFEHYLRRVVLGILKRQ